MDSRTSDAVAIAIRFKAPIFTYDVIIDEAGIILDKDFVNLEEDVAVEKTEKNDGLTNLSIKELKDKLTKAIESEDYELASKIRDEIEKRSK